MCMAYTIEAQGLTKAFGTPACSTGSTWQIEAGEVFALLGPNGAGKTTTVRILTTLLRPTPARRGSPATTSSASPRPSAPRSA